MKYLEIIPDFLTMYGVFTSQSTSQVRQEMSIIDTMLSSQSRVSVKLLVILVIKIIMMLLYNVSN